MNSGSSTSLTFDANGNMTQDQAGNTYSWDCENRLLSIVYPGSGNHSNFTYDPLGRKAKIQEYVSSSLSNTKQFIWDSRLEVETRDASSAITAQFLGHGETIAGTSYFYNKERLGTVTEMCDSTGNVQAQYAFDPYGRTAKLSGSLSADIQFAGHILHARSGLSLTRHRTYNPNLGIWLSRDPLGKAVQHAYAYANNDPINLSDPFGLVASGGTWGTGPVWGCHGWGWNCDDKPPSGSCGGTATGDTPGSASSSTSASHPNGTKKEPPSYVDPETFKDCDPDNDVSVPVLCCLANHVRCVELAHEYGPRYGREIEWLACCATSLAACIERTTVFKKKYKKESWEDCFDPDLIFDYPPNPVVSPFPFGG